MITNVGVHTYKCKYKEWFQTYSLRLRQSYHKLLNAHATPRVQV